MMCGQAPFDLGKCTVCDTNLSETIISALIDGGQTFCSAS